MARVLVVSNRLPVTVAVDHRAVHVVPSSGGLVTAMQGPHGKSDSLWIGWPGDVSRLTDEQKAELGQQLHVARMVPVYLTAGDITKYYDGFSNGVLWPLYHYLIDKIDRDAWAHWRTYAEVNRKFCDAVVEQYRDGDIIWVQDYQLSLLPLLLRQRLPAARIGFFLHIPFPSSEVFRILPWRAEVLEGMLGADVIGFHTYAYLRHFGKSLLHTIDLEAGKEQVVFAGRTVALRVFPIGIDCESFDTLARSPAVLAEAEALVARSDERRLLLGVDRLDYTKGLPRRMMAFERFLEREPHMRDKVRFVQVVVPSRDKVESYAHLRRELDEMAGRINGRFGSATSVPMHYLYKAVTPAQLVALYRAASVMLVTPLRDGMNLVAKEFIASRPDERGVLLLSEFAGAASELAEALIINPYDVDLFAASIKRALIMPEEEQQTRMRSLRQRVAAFDAFHWHAANLAALHNVPERQGLPQVAVSGESELSRLIERFNARPSRVLILDYDGTLVPFARTPNLAAPDPELRWLLRRLAEQRDLAVHIVSGRNRETLQRWLGDLPLGLHAEHGFWSRFGAKEPWQSRSDELPVWKEQVRAIMEQFTGDTPGSMIEEKSAGLAWHYRMAEPELGTIRAGDLVEFLGNMPGLPINILQGHKVIEVRQQGIHKGLVVRSLLERADEVPAIIAFGDDRTDEDLFAHLPPEGFAVHVGSGTTGAFFRVPDVAATRKFLRRFVE